LSNQASSSWAVEGDQGQIVVRYNRERLGRPTFWLRNRGASYRNAKGVDGESPEDEEGESGIGEHDDMDCREEEQITTAPGMKLGRQERRTWTSCTAAERIGECTPTLL